MLKTSSTASTLSQKLGMANNEALNKKLSNFNHPVFLTADPKQAFTQLRQAIIKTLILSYFDW